MPDKQLILDIVSCADQYHANAVAMMATALHESGGQYHPTPGDHGTSFGPFQHHIGGALGNHDRAWAESKAAVCERAQAFARAKVKDGFGAARVQRPASPATYAMVVNTLLPSAARYVSQARAGNLPEGDSSGNIDTASTDRSIGDIASGVIPDDVKSALGAIAWPFTHGQRSLMAVGGIILIVLGVVVVIKTEVVSLPVPNVS